MMTAGRRLLQSIRDCNGLLVSVRVCKALGGFVRKGHKGLCVAQVIEQVEHVALAVKQGSEISDLRHHAFLAPSLKVLFTSTQVQVILL